jgi:hypothetical protein
LLNFYSQSQERFNEILSKDEFEKKLLHDDNYEQKTINLKEISSQITSIIKQVGTIEYENETFLKEAFNKDNR